MTILIYRFGGGKADGNASMKNLLGGKGANLAEMSGLELPVPPGFTIPTTACNDYQTILPPEFVPQMEEALTVGLTYITHTLGHQPLVSVRSGARVSMPGMMDTILNVGITSKTLPKWEKKLGARAALDSYRRLIQMLGSVALKIPMEAFEDKLHALKGQRKVDLDSQLSESALETLVADYLKVVADHSLEFPDTYEEQLMTASLAVFESWQNDRAKEYRKINDIPEDWGTAVTVQAMVFGNLNDQSATGVIFTRNPSSGATGPVGEFLVNAQGEDVVAGIRTPESAEKMFDWNVKVAGELTLALHKLETHYQDMQDVEFTVEDGKLFILQTRNAKRSPQAAFQVAHDMAVEGLITQAVAASRVSAAQLFSVMQDSIDPAFTTEPTFKGIAAGGGIVSGIAVLTSADAVNCKTPCILVTKETDPDDIAGMHASVGILTATGGLTSHAAVVGRGMNKTCVVGTTDMQPGTNVKQGATVTMDGATGNVWVNVEVPTIPGGASEVVKKVLSWLQPEEYITRVELGPLLTTVDDFKKAIRSAMTDPQAPLHFDVCKLDGNGYWANTNTGQYLNMLSWALADMDDFKGTIHLDVTPAYEHRSRGDAVFDGMFAISDTDLNIKEALKASRLVDRFDSLKDHILIKGCPAHLRDYYKSKGFKTSGILSTVADLLDPEVPTTLTPESITKVFGTQEAYDTAFAALMQAGLKMAKPLPVVRYWYDGITKKGA